MINCRVDSAPAAVTYPWYRAYRLENLGMQLVQVDCKRRPCITKFPPFLLVFCGLYLQNLWFSLVVWRPLRWMLDGSTLVGVYRCQIVNARLNHCDPSCSTWVFRGTSMLDPWPPYIIQNGIPRLNTTSWPTCGNKDTHHLFKDSPSRKRQTVAQLMCFTL